MTSNGSGKWMVLSRDDSGLTRTKRNCVHSGTNSVLHANAQSSRIMKTSHRDDYSCHEIS